MNLISDEKINRVLLNLADEVDKKYTEILKANAFDLVKLEPCNPLYDRLQLTPEHVQAIGSDVRNVANLPSPLGRTMIKRLFWYFTLHYHYRYSIWEED